MVENALLAVKNLRKEYTRGLLSKQVTFQIEADFTIEKPGIVGLMGPNGSGKTTLFELITGSNLPTRGEVYCNGHNIHNVKYTERDRLAIHYHQSYQVRHFKHTKPNFMLNSAECDYPMIHLFDEPQFNTQDGYIGFMLDFFQALKEKGRLVFMCVHPHEPIHLEIMQEVCEQYYFVHQGRVKSLPDYTALVQDEHVRSYLGHLIE